MNACGTPPKPRGLGNPWNRDGVGSHCLHLTRAQLCGASASGLRELPGEPQAAEGTRVRGAGPQGWGGEGIKGTQLLFDPRAGPWPSKAPPSLPVLEGHTLPTGPQRELLSGTSWSPTGCGDHPEGTRDVKPDGPAASGRLPLPSPGLRARGSLPASQRPDTG